MTPTPLRIAVAANGARRTKADHPAIPINPVEIARDALACAQAGAQMIHLHVRDAQDRHSLDVHRYRAAIAAIRDTCGDRLTIQVTTESCGIYDRTAQMSLVRTLRPEAASFGLAELIPDAAAEAEASVFFNELPDFGTVPQFILYSPDEVDRLAALIARGVVRSTAPDVLFVLGRYTTGQISDPAALFEFVRRAPSHWTWSVCAFGSVERATAAAAIAVGGHVRVGFENNLFHPDGSLLASNAEQVAQVAAIGRLLGRMG